MDRISGANYATVGGKRQFQDLNLAANQLGTELPALFFNGVQETALAPVEDIGLVPSDADNTQLLQAMKLYGGANLQTITATPAQPLTIQNAGIVLVNAAAGAIAITLPAASAANGKPIRFLFVRTDTSANAVTVAHAGADVLRSASWGDLGASVNVYAGSPRRLVADGAGNWITPTVPFLAPLVSAAGGDTIGASYSGSQTVSFTAPSAGTVLCWGKMNLAFQGATGSSIVCTLALNGTTLSLDSTRLSQSHFGAAAVAAGAAVSVSVTVTSGTTSPAVSATWAAAALFLPSM